MLFMAMCSTAASTASTAPPPTVASPPPAPRPGWQPGSNPVVNGCNTAAAALPTGAANNAECTATAKQVPSMYHSDFRPNPCAGQLNLAAFPPITTCTHLSSAYHVLCSDLNKCYNKVISGGMSEGGLIALVIAILLFIGVLVVTRMYRGVLMAAVTRAPLINRGPTVEVEAGNK